AAVGENLPPMTRGHAGTEAVRALPSGIVGLISALHDDCSRRLRALRLPQGSAGRSKGAIDSNDISTCQTPMRPGAQVAPPRRGSLLPATRNPANSADVYLHLGTGRP